MHVLIVDDNLPLCEGVVRWLSRGGEFGPVSCQPDWRQAENDVRNGTFDIVLLDIDLPGISGLHLIAPLMRASPTAKVIVFSGAASRASVERALDNGAAGYIVKDPESLHIPQLLRRAVAGEVVLCPIALEALMGPAAIT